MKKIEKIMQSKSYIMGYNKGKKEVLDAVKNFIDKESKFLPDIHSDALLDRLVDLLKKI